MAHFEAKYQHFIVRISNPRFFIQNTNNIYQSDKWTKHDPENYQKKFSFAFNIYTESTRGRYRLVVAMSVCLTVFPIARNP